MDLDPSILVQLAFLVMALLYFFRPPMWLSSLMDRFDEQVKDLRQWAPRLVGALGRGGPEAQAALLEEAQGQGSDLVQLLTAVAQLAPLLRDPNIMGMLSQVMNSGGIQGQEERSDKGGWPGE